jgi:dienelactone hydrolase
MSASAKIVTRTVAYQHGDAHLKGFLAYDDAGGTALKPGVLVLPEWWGLNDYPKHRAEQLAQLGYVAFVADMYGDGQTTTDPKKAGELAGQFYGKSLMAERAKAGLDQLVAAKGVDAKRVAASGYCFGGAVAQSLAWSGAPLAGIVTFHGSPVPPSAEAAARTKAKVLICHGAVDPFVKPEELAAFKKALDDGKLDYQLISYAGAIHAFTNPDADRMAKLTGLSGIGYNEAADRRSWAQLKLFFDEIFSSHK